MTLPALFPPRDLGRVQFQRNDLIKPHLRYGEPGTWWDGHRKDLISGCFAAVVMTVDAELTGVEPSVGDWIFTVTPITTQHGAAAADHMAPASITVAAADAVTLAATVLAAIAAAADGSSLTEAADLETWTRFASYVKLSVSPTGAAFLRFTSVTSGQEFSVSITAPAGNSYTLTTVASPSATTLKVGFYCAIDRTKGSNGYNAIGQPYLKPIEASTPESDIVGPIYFGDGTEDVSPGFPYREFEQRKDVPLVSYGHPLVYAYTTIPASSIGSPVYVRHTASGDWEPGMATDEAGAALGATANVWTMTPVVANDTLYQMQIVYGSSTVLLTYLSDGTAADTEITAGMLAQLNLYNGDGQALDGITGVDGATLVLTGPADGRSFAVTSIGVGDMGEAETTPGATTHIMLTRGDKWLAESSHVSAPVDVPHSNA